MFRYFRTRPLLFAASAMATLIGGPLLVVFAVAALSDAKTLAPQQVMAEALAMHRDPLSSKKLFRPLNGWNRGEWLRGVTEAEAEQILASCRNASDWTYSGEEERIGHDCARYELASCSAGEGTIVARLWMDWDAVDHLGDLALNSDFLACRKGQCPDFAVGEPQNDGVHRCETRFKVNGTSDKP